MTPELARKIETSSFDPKHRMRREPPPGFDLSTFLKDIYTFQKWELFPGISTQGKDVVATMKGLGVPADLTGKRVLDIAPWNGFFSFECVRRGAAEVVSLGPDNPEETGYNRVRDLLEIKNCKYVRASVYDLSPEIHGTFDIVFFLGVIYHLRHPLLALDKIYDVAKSALYVDTPIIDWVVHDKTVTEELRHKILNDMKEIHTLPLLYFTKGNETGDLYNWFIPNRRALSDLLQSSGFQVTSNNDDGYSWAWLSAVKGTRSFTVGLEGFNEPIARVATPNN